MDLKQLSKTFNYEDIALEKVFLIAANTHDRNGSEFLQQMDLLYDDELIQLFPRIAQYLDDDYVSADLPSLLFRFGYLGFVALVSTPVRKPNGDYSWGHYRTEWVYADTMKSLIQTALNVGRQLIKKDLQTPKV